MDAKKIHSFFSVLRLIMIASVMGWGSLAPLDENSRWSLFLCLTAGAVLGLVFFAILYSEIVNAAFVYRLALAADLGLVYWGVQVTGSAHSNLIVGFYLLVAFHAFHSGIWIGIGSSLCASVLLLTMPSAGIWWGDSLMRIGFLQILAVGAGLLSERERMFVHNLSETRRAVEQAEKMAVLGTLGAGIAHEVNNPTSSIIARAERVLLEARERGMDPETVRDLEVIRKHAVRIGAILQRLLAFARPEGFDARLLNMNHIIEGIVSLVEGRLREKRMSLNLDLMHGPANVIGEQTRLEEVILNILNNSIDASYWGSVIDVTTKVRHDFFEISIADKGAGIDPKNLSRVFDPFFTTKPAGQGTGLGLYVAWQIMKDHGGKLSITSEPHSGTTVTLQFPLVTVSDQELAATTSF